MAILAGGLAHEIRNPLSTLTLNLELLAEDAEEGETPRDRRMLQRISRLQDECHHLEEILNAFLQFTRSTEPERVPLDLNQLVHKFIDFYTPRAQENSVEISLHLGSDLPMILGDPLLLRQVLTNLVANAEQAMPEGGTIELQTAHQQEQVILAVIDTGKGISPQGQEKMFDPFFSTKSGGSGLGLPTVRKIVHAHNGEIRCESEQGKGTRFLLSFPISQNNG